MRPSSTASCSGSRRRRTTRSGSGLENRGARNYTFDGGQIARLLAPMAASPAAAVEAAVMLLRRAVPRIADPAAAIVEAAVAALVYDEQRADVKARARPRPGRHHRRGRAPRGVSSTAAEGVLGASRTVS